MFGVARIVLLVIGVALVAVPWWDAKASGPLFTGGGVLVILLAVIARRAAAGSGPGSPSR